MSIISLSTTVSLCCDGKHYLVQSRKQFTNLKQEKLKPCGTCGSKMRNSSPLYNSKRQLQTKWYLQRWIAGINESDDTLQTDVAGLPGSPVGAIQLKGFFGEAANTLPPEWGFRGDRRLKYNTKLHGGSDSFKLVEVGGVSCDILGLKNCRRQHEGEDSMSFEIFCKITQEYILTYSM